MSDFTFPPTEAYAPERIRPWWFKLIGARPWATWDGRSVRCWWGEFSLGGGIGLNVTRYGDENPAHVAVHLVLFSAYIGAPWLNGLCPEHEAGLGHEGYGFHTFGDAVHCHWGRHTKLWRYPWAREWVSTRYLTADLQWVEAPTTGFLGGRKWVDWRETAWSERHPYRYMLRSGEVQERFATIRRERREWRWLWFGRGLLSRALRHLQWWGRMVHETIDVEFSDEVGERTGSWKGGTIGCGYDMRPGESPRKALRRMEQERRF